MAPFSPKLFRSFRTALLSGEVETIASSATARSAELLSSGQLCYPGKLKPADVDGLEEFTDEGVPDSSAIRGS